MGLGWDGIGIGMGLRWDWDGIGMGLGWDWDKRQKSAENARGVVKNEGVQVAVVFLRKGGGVGYVY